MKYALINADGLVVNAIVWDGEVDYTPADGLTVVAIPDGVGAGPGWTYDGTDWIAPPPVEDEEGEG
jgi:hypothetical protein